MLFFFLFHIRLSLRLFFCFLFILFCNDGLCFFYRLRFSVPFIWFFLGSMVFHFGSRFQGTSSSFVQFSIFSRHATPHATPNTDDKMLHTNRICYRHKFLMLVVVFLAILRFATTIDDVHFNVGSFFSLSPSLPTHYLLYQLQKLIFTILFCSFPFSSLFTSNLFCYLT